MKYPNFNEEKKLWKKRYKFVAGLDEAGRGCERPDAEILTDNGWKFYFDVDLKDRVLSLTNEGQIEWQTIERIVEKDFYGYLIQLKNRSINIIVTPDHYFNVLRRVFKRDKKDRNKLKLVGYKMRRERKIVSELDTNDFIPRGGIWNGLNTKIFKLPRIDKSQQKSINIELWVAFLGIFLSEGSVFYDKKKGSYKITISQSKGASPEKYKKISRLLEKLPFHFNQLKDGFNCYNKQLYTYLRRFGDKYTKFIPNEIKNLSSNELNILIEWMLLGDGSYYIGKNRKKVSVYYTASDKLKDDFEEILLKAGWTYHTSKRPLKDRYINGRLIKKENQRDCFETRLRRNNKAHIKSLHKREVLHMGKVFCLQLAECHNFFVRRDGTGYFTGNSLSGPVVAAAVVINSKHEILNTKKTPNSKSQITKRSAFKIRKFKNSDLFRVSDLEFRILIKDSKQLSPTKREKVYKMIVSCIDIVWGIGIVSEKIIDKINILEATKQAMQKAVQDLEKKLAKPQAQKTHDREFFARRGFLILDGNFSLNVDLPQKSIIKGDEKVMSCALASVIAKVTRDRLMRKLHEKYPQYGFDRHKGYGTKAHFACLEKFGPCKIHRKTFRPVNKA